MLIISFRLNTSRKLTPLDQHKTFIGQLYHNHCIQRSLTLRVLLRFIITFAFTILAAELWPFSTVKSDQKIRFSETISFKRFLNVILVLKVSLTNSGEFSSLNLAGALA